MTGSLNENWARWVFASIAYYLKQVAEGESIPALVDGLDERADEFLNAPHRVEIRINGPFIQAYQSEYRLWADANVLLTSVMDEARHTMYRLAGKFQASMAGPIPVLDYGDQPGDTGELLIGCLRLRGRDADGVELFNFGQVEKNDRVKQAIVNARYEMFLE